MVPDPLAPQSLPCSLVPLVWVDIRRLERVSSGLRAAGPERGVELSLRRYVLNAWYPRAFELDRRSMNCHLMFEVAALPSYPEVNGPARAL